MFSPDIGIISNVNISYQYTDNLRLIFGANIIPKYKAMEFLSENSNLFFQVRYSF